MKTRNIIWIVAAVAALGGAVLCSQLLMGGFRAGGGYLIAGVAIGLLAWKAFTKKDDSGLREELATLRKTVKDLDRELSEKSRSRFNVVELNPIMHIAVLDVDTSFVRPYVREDKHLTFNGALRADLKVEYGIRLEEVKFQYDPMANHLTLSNFHPGIISYSRKQLKWEFAKSYRSRKLFGHGFSDISDRDADTFTKETCEKLRAELEEEIDTRNVSEFDWLSPLITDQVVDVLKLMVGRDSLNVTISDNAEGDFVGLQEFRQMVAVPQIENQ